MSSARDCSSWMTSRGSSCADTRTCGRPLRAARHPRPGGGPALRRRHRPAITTGGRACGPERAVHLAVTAAGLRRLELLARRPLDGLPARVHRRDGRACPQPRARRRRRERPARRGTGAGPTPSRSTCCCSCTRRTRGRSRSSRGRSRPRYKRGGVTELRRLDTEAIGDREHFGFRDGISQPIIAGLGHTGAGRARRARRRVRARLPQRVRPAHRPAARARSRRPRRGAAARSRPRRARPRPQRHVPRHAPDAAGRGRVLASSRRAAGRRPATHRPGRQDGGPLAERRAPRRGARRRRPGPCDRERLRLLPASTRTAMRCPIGAHVRRSNPRDSLDPSPGTPGSLAVNRRHRLLRRGRKYGPPADVDGLRGGTAIARRGRPRPALHLPRRRTSPASSSSSSGRGWGIPSSPRSTTTPIR